MPKCSIVTPAFNEEENLSHLIPSLLAAAEYLSDTTEIILVNDNSRDRTGEIAEEYAREHPSLRVIHRKSDEHGMGLALNEGTREAQGDYIIWTMADASDDPESFHRMVGKLDEGYDMVFASRYMRGGSRGNLDPVKAFLSSTYTRMTRIVFGVPVHDITNAFRAFRKEVFDSVVLDSHDFAISPEFAIKAHLKGFRLGEVSTTYRDREQGMSKFNIPLMMMKYMKLFKYRFTSIE